MKNPVERINISNKRVMTRRKDLAIDNAKRAQASAQIVKIFAR